MLASLDGGGRGLGFQAGNSWVHWNCRLKAHARRDKSQRRPKRSQYREAEVFGLVLSYPNRSATPPKRKPAELLAELEFENAALRHQAVDLALQIQALQENKKPLFQCLAVGQAARPPLGLLHVSRGRNAAPPQINSIHFCITRRPRAVPETSARHRT